MIRLLDFFEHIIVRFCSFIGHYLRPLLLWVGTLITGFFVFNIMYWWLTGLHPLALLDWCLNIQFKLGTRIDAINSSSFFVTFPSSK